MGKRIQFRWILPSLMTILNLCLVSVSISEHPHAQTASSVAVSAKLREAAFQEGQTVFVPMDPPPLGGVYKAELLLNLPAVVGGGIVSEIFRREGEPALIAFTTLFVPFLWSSIGSWIDRQRAFPAADPAQPRWGRKILQRTLQVIAWVLLIACFFTQTVEYHHQTSDSKFMAITLLLWTGGYLACSTWGERRLRSAMSA